MQIFKVVSNLHQVSFIHELKDLEDFSVVQLLAPRISNFASSLLFLFFQ